MSSDYLVLGNLEGTRVAPDIHQSPHYMCIYLLHGNTYRLSGGGGGGGGGGGLVQESPYQITVDRRSPPRLRPERVHMVFGHTSTSDKLNFRTRVLVIH